MCATQSSIDAMSVFSVMMTARDGGIKFGVQHQQPATTTTTTSC
jgi:hypothetical protein